MNCLVADAFGLEHRQTQFQRERFDGRRLRFEFAPLGPVRLGDDGGDLELCIGASASRLAQDNSAVPRKSDSQRRHADSQREIARGRKENIRKTGRAPQAGHTFVVQLEH